MKQQPIDINIIEATIKQAQNAVKAIMETSGDRWLPSGLDPYIEDAKYGCYFYAESNKQLGPGMRRQHLTWGILSSTLVGLYHFAVIQRYSQEMEWRVLDASWGFVGSGKITAGSAYPGLAITNRTREQTANADS